jgi:hypothetical protein
VIAVVFTRPRYGVTGLATVLLVDILPIHSVSEPLRSGMPEPK